MKEWERFKVGTPSLRPNWTETTCASFDTVSHTSHIDSAIKIIRQEEIHPSLVFDESILNKQRILVSWLSPNHWSIGYRYGNIRFEFDFATLIKDKYFYWVESIAYKIPAYRILITDRSRDEMLPRYDPTLKNGPWWFDIKTGTHYFNSHYCLELMLEAPVSLTTLRAFHFEHHHDHYCSIYRNAPSRCAELGFRDLEGGAYFLARAAVTGTNLRRVLSLDSEHNSTAGIFRSVFNRLVFAVVGKDDPSGAITATSSESIALGRAIMSAYTYGRLEEARLLAGYFADLRALVKTMTVILTEVTGNEVWPECAC